MLFENSRKVIAELDVNYSYHHKNCKNGKLIYDDLSIRFIQTFTPAAIL